MNPAETAEEQARPLQNLDRITTRKVSPGDLADNAVCRYLVQVIMAPMADEYQNVTVASDILGALRGDKTQAYWILGANGKRVGAIAFSVGPYSTRPSEKDIKVLYVVGMAVPEGSPDDLWDTLINEGRGVAKALGCRNIMFDVAPNGPLTQGIIKAGLASNAQIRFTLEV